MSDIRVLVVEDEPAIRELIKVNLERIQYIVDEASDIILARQVLIDNKPDIILLDWMLPITSGVTWLQELKLNPDTREIPVIMVTARSEEENRVHGLNAGCDDYIVKPFFPSELIARIQAVLRRNNNNGTQELIKFEDLVINSASKRATIGDKVLQLGPLEFNILEFLAKRPDRVFTRASLLDQVWKDNTCIEERTIDVHIRGIRKTLESHGYAKFIQTVRGSGYMFSNYS